MYEIRRSGWFLLAQWAAWAMGCGPAATVDPGPLDEAADVTLDDVADETLEAPLVQAGGPILIVKNRLTPQFGAYYAEILKSEGVSSFDTLELNELGDLARYQVLLLAETPLTAAQAQRLVAWVEAGGRLVAMRPAAALLPLLGLGPATRTQAEGFIRADAAKWGVYAGPLQVHGVADLHPALAGTSVVATFSTGAPAITMRTNVGAGKGTAVAYMYDLARSVVYTRQGNPARVDGPRLNNSFPRSSELFAPDYLDTASFGVAHADEQQRLLVNLLYAVNNDRTPLPRLWYLPGGRKVAVVMTGDDHNANGSVELFERLKAASPAGCETATWTCPRATSWIYSNVAALKGGGAGRYVAQGFEVGPHVAMTRDGPCATWSSDADLLTRFRARRSEFTSDYGIAPGSTTRSHCFVWMGWDTHARVARQAGVRLDENYTPYALRGTLGRLGHLNGSAMPMKFASSAGATLDVYQLVSDMDYEYFPSGTTKAAMRQAIGGLLARSTGPNEFWGFLGTHYDYSGGAEALFRDGLLEEVAARSGAGQRHIPLISAKQLLSWLDLRDGSTFQSTRFNGTMLTFSLVLKAGVPNPGLEAMVPQRANGRTLAAIRRNGAAVPVKRVETIRTVPYAFFDAAGGSYQVDYR